LPPPISHHVRATGIWKNRVAKNRVLVSSQKTPDTGLTSIRVAKLGNAYPGDTITVVGTAGTPGVDGAPGTNGGPGGDATATAGPNSDPSNTASAIGGAGGKGGASTDIGVPSGNGGAAGNATATAARIQPKTCRPDLRPHSGGWRCAEGNLPGHKHAGAIDPVQLAATASRVCTKVYVRKKISDSRPVRGRDRGDQG
jgi:hypothetical protein